MISISYLQELAKKRQTEIADNTEKKKHIVPFIVEEKLKRAAYLQQTHTTVNIAFEIEPENFKKNFRISLEDVNVNDIVEKFDEVVKSLQPLGYTVCSNAELFTKSKHYVIEW